LKFASFFNSFETLKISVLDKEDGTQKGGLEVRSAEGANRPERQSGRAAINDKEASGISRRFGAAKITQNCSPS